MRMKIRGATLDCVVETGVCLLHSAFSRYKSVPREALHCIAYHVEGGMGGARKQKGKR